MSIYFWLQPKCVPLQIGWSFWNVYGSGNIWTDLCADMIIKYVCACYIEVGMCVYGLWSLFILCNMSCSSHAIHNIWAAENGQWRMKWWNKIQNDTLNCIRFAREKEKRRTKNEERRKKNDERRSETQPCETIFLLMLFLKIVMCSKYERWLRFLCFFVLFSTIFWNSDWELRLAR